MSAATPDPVTPLAETDLDPEDEEVKDVSAAAPNSEGACGFDGDPGSILRTAPVAFALAISEVIAPIVLVNCRLWSSRDEVWYWVTAKRSNRQKGR